MTLERILERDRVVVLGGLALIAGLSWLYLAKLASGTGPAAGMASPRMEAWTPSSVLLLFVMWAVMMAAMMVPSAAPMVLIFASVHRKRREQGRPSVPTAFFVFGYLIVWTAYSAVATLAQWGLHSAALLSPTMVSTSAALGGGLLVAAGVFQWTPLKDACLTACRSPMAFLMRDWREGTRGALVMGLRHGSYCVGCCWAIMALLFVAGVMNLVWVAALAAFVLIEKAAPAGVWVGRVAGIVLVGWGLWLLTGAVV